jgi:hypothetical protein
MRHTIAAAALLLLIGTAWGAETVTSLSAPFTFPLSTRVVAAAQAVAPAGLGCRNLTGGGLRIRWTLDQGATSGRVSLTGLDGRLVASCTVKAEQGSVVLAHTASGVYLATLTTGISTHTARIAIGQ